MDTLAASLGEDGGTLEDVYEPYLLMNGLINRTPRGEWQLNMHTGIWVCVCRKEKIKEFVILLQLESMI